MAVLNLEQAADYLGISKSLMRRYAASGAIGRKVGREWRFVDTALEAWVLSRPAKKEDELCHSTNVRVLPVGGSASRSTANSYKKALELPTG